MQKMKILILSDDFPPQNFGGSAVVAFNLARGLQKIGQQVFVITTAQNKLYAQETTQDGLKVFRIYANFHEKWQAYLGLYNPQTVSRVNAIIKEIKPDIVHVHDIHSYLSYHCLKIAKKYSKAVLLTCHNVMLFNYGKLATKKYLAVLDCRTSWLDHFKQAQKRYNPFRNIIIRYYLKYVDKIFAVSDALKTALNQSGIQNVDVVYNGIDVDDWHVDADSIAAFKKKYGLEGKKIIFFGGRISGLKGISQINQAMVKIKEKIPEAFLLIVGKEGIGWLTGDELKAAYLAADVVVVPSIYLDPFPTINLEAMACKKPVVATCFGGSCEVVQDGITGYVVNPFNIKLLTQRIADLLEDSSKAKRFGEAGFERVKERFSLTSQIDQTLAWYHKLTFDNN